MADERPAQDTSSTGHAATSADQPAESTIEIFPSKVDTWLGFLLLGVPLGLTVSAISVAIADPQRGWPVALTLLAVAALLPTLCLPMRYTLTDRDLLVRAGPFRWRVPLRQITRVTPTSNPLSSPALSLDRLRVEQANGRSLMISPRDKDGFLRELRARQARQGSDADRSQRRRPAVPSARSGP